MYKVQNPESKTNQKIAEQSSYVWKIGEILREFCEEKGYSFNEQCNLLVDRKSTLHTVEVKRAEVVK